MCAETSLSLILIWQDSTANELPDFLASSGAIAPEPKHETYSARPSTSPRTGETTWVA